MLATLPTKLGSRVTGPILFTYQGSKNSLTPAHQIYLADVIGITGVFPLLRWGETH